MSIWNILSNNNYLLTHTDPEQQKPHLITNNDNEFERMPLSPWLSSKASAGAKTAKCFYSLIKWQQMTSCCLSTFLMTLDKLWSRNASASVWSFEEIITDCGNTFSLSREHIPGWCWCVDERWQVSADRIKKNREACDWFPDTMTANSSWYHLVPPHWAVGLQWLCNWSFKEK